MVQIMFREKRKKIICEGEGGRVEQVRCNEDEKHKIRKYRIRNNRMVLRKRIERGRGRKDKWILMTKVNICRSLGRLEISVQYMFSVSNSLFSPTKTGTPIGTVAGDKRMTNIYVHFCVLYSMFS